MTEENKPELEQPAVRTDEEYEKPAIVALGKLDKVTFGAAGPPFEGATSYL